MYRLQFGTGDYYHIFNRGLDRRDLFIETRDYTRFLAGVYHFNDANFKPQNFEYQGLTLINEKREEMIDIIAWCLMPNHYHLLLRQKTENGITKFMRRLGTGFTMYTNLKYKHSGHIFQVPFKAKHIEQDTYLQHLTRYIHLNPLDCYDATWKEKGVKNIEAGKKFILNYQWSSLNDYLGNRRFPELVSDTAKEIIFDINTNEYLEFLSEWMETGIPSQYADSIKV